MKCESKELIFSDCTPVSYARMPFDSTLLCQTQDGEPASVLIGDGYPIVEAYVMDPDTLVSTRYYQTQTEVTKFIPDQFMNDATGVCDDSFLYADMSLSPKVIEDMKAKGNELQAEIAKARDFFRKAEKQRRLFGDMQNAMTDLVNAKKGIEKLYEANRMNQESLKPLRLAMANIENDIGDVGAKVRKLDDLRYQGYGSFDSFMRDISRKGTMNPFERFAVFSNLESGFRGLASRSDRRPDSCSNYNVYYNNPLTGESFSREVKGYCGGWGTGCFSEGASLYLKDGGQISMKDLAERFIEKRDVPAIATMNEQTQEIEYQVPSKVIVHDPSGSHDFLDITFEKASGETSSVLVTPNHPIALCGGERLEYVPAGALEIGALVCGGGGDDVMVSGIETAEMWNGGLYDLHMDGGNHNYLVSDEGKPIVAHNKIF